jgi:hypothetical protein
MKTAAPPETIRIGGMDMNTNAIASRAAAGFLALLLLTTTGLAYGADAKTFHIRNHGKLTIAEPVTLGGLALEPGEYEVKAKDTPSGTEVEFSRWNYDPYVSEGLPVYTLDFVGFVKAVPQTAALESARTVLMLAAGDHGKPVGLRIKGNSLEYLFPTGATQVAAQTPGW